MHRSTRKSTMAVKLTKSSKKDLFILACRHYHRGPANLAWLKEFKKEIVFVEKTNSKSRKNKRRTTLDDIFDL